MKIVVNKCFGGFELSLKAMKEYYKLKGITIYPYARNIYNHEFEEYSRTNENDIFNSYFTKDYGETFRLMNEDINNEVYYFDIDRTDKDLIQVVEKLGKEANGKFSSLCVVEIPDGIEWEIDDYDGIETVEEKHRSW